MFKLREFEQLGASLYIPANHKDLTDISNGVKHQHLRSMIFCTEDSLFESDLEPALRNLQRTLSLFIPRSDTHRYVRVRNPQTLNRVLNMPGAELLDGFVLPKLTRQNFNDYFHQIQNTQHMLMPTLETREVFDDREMRMLRRQLTQSGVQERILTLRIGGNDLLALLGIRRPRNITIYRTPLGPVIARLVTTFRPYGFQLTAPVFEHMDLPCLLEQEVAEDLDHGLCGKTAIHPDQVPLIERHYKVADIEIEMAHRILSMSSPAVFKSHGSMCEVATHREWAHAVNARARVFGILSAVDGVRIASKREFD